MCQNNKFPFLPAVLRKIAVSLWERPQGDDDWLSPVAGWTTFSGLYSPATLLHLHMSHAEHITPYPSCFFSSFTTPPTTSTNPHQLLHMNNARSLLNRRNQHATACFIHNKVRQISAHRRPDPWVARWPQSHQHQLSASARSVSLTCTSLQRKATPLFNGGTELQVNIWI